MHNKSQQPPLPRSSRKHQWLAIFIVLFSAVAVGALVLLAAQQALLNYLASEEPHPAVPSTSSTEIPKVTVQKVIGGLEHPWDIVFLPDGTMLFNQRAGTISTLRNGQGVQIAAIDDVYSRGEGGLMGMALDPKFEENRYLYTCYTSAHQPGSLAAGPRDIRIVRWKLNKEVTGLEDRHDIVTGIPTSEGGRHSGCRMAFGPEEYLWVGTGDTANAALPQDPQSLGGKILRINRDGQPASDNLGSNFDPRIYSYGHRNTQGIAIAPNPINGIIGFSIEHGPVADDEVNPLLKGNFGWAPAGYDALQENDTPMTDKQKFPDAIAAVWSSGSPTQAPSGADFVVGPQWKAWNGSLAIAMLKAKHLKILTFDQSGKVIKEDKLLTDQGRLRTVRQAPDGSLYVITDNGKDDRIIRLMPQN